MIKKYFFGILASMMMLCAYTASAEIVVTVNEEPIALSQPPVIINDRTMVPLRSIFEALGAYVDWDDGTKTVIAQRRFDKVVLTIGDNIFFVNGEQKQLDTPAVIIDNRTMIPVRAVAEALGAQVVWSAPTKTVEISSNFGEHKIQDTYIDFWETNTDDVVVLTGRIAYPEIVEPVDEMAAAFNEFIMANTEESIDKFLMENLERAVSEHSSAANDEFCPYMYEQCFDITYDRDGIMSVCCLENSFLNGVRTDRNMFAINFSLTDGKILTACDMLKKSESEIRRLVYDEFMDLIAANPDKFFVDVYDCLDDSLSKLNWYIAEDGVHFFVNPNEIAAGAEGFIEIVLK